MAKLDKIARDLVLRSRAGDQNALALIATIREDAPKSKKAKKALAAILDYIEKNPSDENSSETNSIPDIQPIGIHGTRIGVESARALGHLKHVANATHAISEESDKRRLQSACGCLATLPFVGGQEASNAASVILANGLPLNQVRVADMADAVTNPEYKNAFLHAVNGSLSSKDAGDSLLPYVFAGEMVGKARAIQFARSPHHPFNYGISNRAYAELGDSYGQTL